jgi:5-methylcytosine-specific restriction endonuclease McrA
MTISEGAFRALAQREARQRWHAENRPRDIRLDPVDYQSYLESDEWLSFRDSVIAAYERKCACCGVPSYRLQVHHLHYDTLGWEVIDDVEPLCQQCHAIADETRATSTAARRIVQARRTPQRYRA